MTCHHWPSPVCEMASPLFFEGLRDNFSFELFLKVHLLKALSCATSWTHSCHRTWHAICKTSPCWCPTRGRYLGHLCQLQPFWLNQWSDCPWISISSFRTSSIGKNSTSHTSGSGGRLPGQLSHCGQAQAFGGSGENTDLWQWQRVCRTRQDWWTTSKHGLLCQTICKLGARQQWKPQRLAAPIHPQEKIHVHGHWWGN